MKVTRRNVKVFFGRPHANTQVKEALSDGTIASWMGAAEARPSEVAPTIYDLLALCEDLSRTHPVQARAAIAKLKWLMKMSTRQTGTSWDHPWESNR